MISNRSMNSRAANILREKVLLTATRRNHTSILRHDNEIDFLSNFIFAANAQVINSPFGHDLVHLQIFSAVAFIYPLKK